jgi:hypothetical protein
MVECDNGSCENLIGCGQGVEIDGYLYCCENCKEEHTDLRNNKVKRKHEKPEK